MGTRLRLVRALSLLGVLALALASVSACTGGRRGGGGLPRDAGEAPADSGGTARDAGFVPPGTDAGFVPPGTDAGFVPPGTDAGRPPGVDAGVSGVCADVTGSYTVTGDCLVTACTVTQDGCGVSAACDGPIGTLTGTIAGTSAMLTSPFGTCLVDVDTTTGVLSGTCVAGSTVCGFDATPG